MGCIEMEQLLDFAEDQLEPKMADQIRAHLASGCSRCQMNLDWIQKTRQLAISDDSVEPPGWVTRRAVQLFQAYGSEPKPKMLDRIVAALTFDSLAQMQPVGVRQTTLAARQCVYQAGDWDVDLSFEMGEDPDSIDLTGQILPGTRASDEAADVLVRLTQGGQLMATTVTDQLGEFTFDSVASGTYDLIIESSEQEIRIEGLNLILDHG